MLREVYIVIMLLNIYHFHVILCFNCMEEDSIMLRAVCSIVKFKHKIINYISTKAWTLEKTRQRLKNSLLNLFEEQVNDTMSRNNKLRGQPALRKKNTIPIIKMGAEELIATHGYSTEAHNIKTEDGYVLRIHRIIPYFKPNISQDLPKPSIILHHGLLGSSEDWLLLDTSSTLPYLLLKYGYDVWLLNARGNKYTTVPFTKFRRTYTFRDFSWHEMGIYDLPAAISYIGNYTNSNDLYYIGYSMGATALLVLLSSIPEFHDFLNSAIFLAPLAFMNNTKGPLKVIAASPNSAYKYMESGDFPEEIIENLCLGSARTCSNTLLFIANGGKEISDYNMMENILSHVPRGGSTKTIAHYIQLIKSGCFRPFDYGPSINIEKYNNTSPPDYNLSVITLPISIITSSSDWISTMPDTMTLINKLQNVKMFHVVRKDNFSHLDFIWSKEAKQVVFNVVMDILEPNSSDINNEYNNINELFTSTISDLIENEYNN